MSKLNSMFTLFIRPHLANIITITRIVLLFATVIAAFSANLYIRIILVPIAILIIALDWIDGIVARKFKCETLFGSVLDIAADRIVENVWWIAFSALTPNVVPLWVPIVIVSRGILTDSIRGLALSQGKTPFGEKTMMNSKLGYYFVASRFSRGLYCFSKILTFSTLFAMNALLPYNDGAYANQPIFVGITFEHITYGLVLWVVAFCIIRGIPVLIDSRELLRNNRLSEKTV